MSQADTAEFSPFQITCYESIRARENGQMQLYRNSFPELLIDITKAFSVEKTIRELSCDLCKVILNRVNERLGERRIDICLIYGLFDGLVRLKGAAGFQSHCLVKLEKIRVGEGVIGQVAKDNNPFITTDLGDDPRANTEIEQSIVKLADNNRVAALLYPLILASGETVGVLLLGKFHDGSLSNRFFHQSGLLEAIARLAIPIATAYDNSKWVNKAKLHKKYHDNEVMINKISRQFYSEKIPDRDLKLIEAICTECIKILNSGNSADPFYQNFLFYEYQEYRKLFVLRSFGRHPRSVLPSFRRDSRHYREYVQDGQVKCVESQARFVHGRGKYPHIIRYLLEDKIQDIAFRLDANWSPAALGTAFIVPLFENEHPLGVLIFWSRKQNRQYINNEPKFYLGPERRIMGLYDLKLFRSLQPLIAGEYHKLKADEYSRRRIVDLENHMGALKEVVLIEEKSEVLGRLAEFTARSMNAEGCIIHLLDPSKTQLTLQATSGFSSDQDLKKTGIYALKRPEPHKPLPVQIFETQNDIIANSGRKFRRLTGNRNPLSLFFRQLKSKKVISYLGRPIGNLGVIEVFNKAKITPSGWSFFEDQDSSTLRHISEVIATVLKRMEATAFQVQSEKVKVTSELLLDISHELKNPLYSSLIFVRKLKSTLNGAADENGVLQTISLIERNVEKAQRILASMQNFQTSMTQTKREPVDLEKIMRMVLQTNASFCEQQRIIIGSEFSAVEPLVFGDELQLNQVFTNLVKNAIDAMPNGGMLTVRLEETSSELHAEITDTGEGIPHEIRDHVFEPFVTTKKPDSGTGLGLALSKRIINQHHGKIEFESELGWGTKFIVTLPKCFESTFSPVKPSLILQPVLES
jgi:signal transduction histidine kinase